MDLIDFARNSLIVLHFVGLAALLGGFMTQIRAMSQAAAKIVPAMVHGAWTAFITGLLLVGLAEWRIAMGATFQIDHTKIAVKTVIALIILVLVILNRKKSSVAAPVFGVIGALTLVNVVVAVFW